MHVLGSYKGEWLTFSFLDKLIHMHFVKTLHVLNPNAFIAKTGYIIQTRSETLPIHTLPTVTYVTYVYTIAIHVIMIFYIHLFLYFNNNAYNEV